jgi:cytoskeletal protein RodZ
MSRRSVLNMILGALAVGLVSVVVYLEATDATSAAATTTSSTTTTLPPTTTSTTSTTSTSTTSTSTTSTTSTLPPTTLPPPERGLVPVVVTSASLSGERVGPTAYLLSVTGWTDVRGVNGAVTVSATVVYFADGLQNAAELMAVDLQIPVTSVAPLATAPPVAGLGNAGLLVYLAPV